MKRITIRFIVLTCLFAGSFPLTVMAAGDVLWNTEVTTTIVNATNYGSPPTDNFTEDGVSFTLNYLFPDHPDPDVYGGGSIPTNTYFVTTGNTVGNEAGVLGFGMNTDEGSAGGEGECIRARFNISPAVGGLTFPLLDIDNASWRDMMLIRATYQGSLVSGTGTIVNASPTVQEGTAAGVTTYACDDIRTEFGQGLCFTGITANAGNTETRGNVDFSFTGLVDQLEVSYCESDNADHSSQLTAFGDFAWDYDADDGFDFGDADSYSDAWHTTSRTAELETISISSVGASWQTANFVNTYTSPVVVCSYTLPSASDNEAVVRVRNAGATSFEVRMQQPLNSSSVTASEVQCLVAEEGEHTLPDGRVYEAHTVLSDGTSGLNVTGGWGSGNTEDVSGDVTGTYTNPVVLGQVMTFNDTDFSVFWSHDCTSRSNPPSAGNICVGKHIGEVNATRSDETLGYIVVEAGSGAYGGISYVAALGADSIWGVGNTPPYSYALSQTYDFAVATQAAMDGGQGGWAVLYGASPLAASLINLAIDEETAAGDSSRAHTTEQVAYWAFTTADQPYIGATRGDMENGSQDNAAADGDDNDGNDDEDGVTFYSPGGGATAEVYADVEVVNDSGGDAYVYAWLDRWTDGGGGTAVLDGSFDSGDSADTPASGFHIVADNNGTATTVTFHWTGLPEVSGFTYARFRVCTTQSECEAPDGHASDGEVEDYRIDFDFTPTAVTIGDVSLEAVGVGDFLNTLGVGQMSRDSLFDLLSVFAPDVAQTLSGADAASILAALASYLDPDGDGQVALIQWNTLEERGTIGFFVEREDHQGGSWTTINQKMLPGLITAPMGGEYVLADPGAVSGTVYHYRLIEKEATGNTRSYGPFLLEMH